METYYLNQSGSRCVSIDANGRRETVPFSSDGGKTIKPRAVRYWESIGNFAACVVRIKGKEQMVFPDSEVELKFYAVKD